LFDQGRGDFTGMIISINFLASNYNTIRARTSPSSSTIAFGSFK